MKRERERETLRDKFNFMRSVIVKNHEITESDFILELDENGIGLATYNKLKGLFRENSLKAGIHYDVKLKLYYSGTRQESLTELSLEQKEDLK